ncbi:MAG: pilus assembly FimT family protein, partial [Christensenellales bacterium]
MLHLHTRADHRDRRGFTLTEVIVVVAILTILLAIAIPSVIGYMTSAEMIRLNQTAKTLYLSAQDALTQAQAGGSLRQINDWSAPLPDAAAEAALSEPEYADNRGNIAYLSLSKADPHGGDADDIRQALFGSIGDKPLLENSILVEYNTKTGVVLSLLYSEKAPAFSYDSALTDRTNPIVRTEQALRAKRQGYYGVTYTGALGSQVELTAPEVMLVNSDRLYLTWTDVTPAGLTDELTYTVTLYDATSGGELLRIENIPNLVSGGLPSMADTETISTEHLPTWAAGAALPDGEGTTHRVGQLDGRLALVLDDVHRSIFEAYPTVPVSEIYASVQPVCPGGDEAVALSNTEHAYFEAVASPVFGADTVLLANARHLNNLRYGPSDANYRQSADIDWAHPEALASPAAGAVDFQSAYFLSRDGAGATRVAGDTFTGSYDGQNRRIAGLTLAPAQDAYDADPVQVSLTSYLGVFPQIKNGQVRDLTLDGVQADFTAPDREVTLAGLIAGRAERAELSGVRVTGESRPSTLTASSLGGEAMIGGLVGDLDKSRITDCAVTTTIQSGQLDSSASGLSVSQGGSQVGGIAGASKNSDLSGCASAATVYGGDELGGLVGLAHNTELTACRFEPGLVLGRDGVGGIVGRQRNGSGRVVDCQVAGALDADRQLETLFAQLAAQPAGFEAYVISAHPGDAGIIGRDRVGGVVGDNQGDVLGFETRAQVRGRGDVGGVVGYNATSAKVSWQGRSHTAAGLVAASGDHAGGVMGLAEGKNQTYDGAQNQAHVLARRYAGGIVGANGTPEGAAGGSIENCVNGGVVYAYQAYAGGIAGCNAGAIEASRSTGGQAERLQALLDLAGLPLGDYVGGVAGYNSGRIVRCQSGSLVMGGSYVGGIVGHNQGKKALIQACDTTGGVILGRGDYVGGLIGLNSTDQFSDPDAISAMGSLVSQADRVEGNRFVGGVIGCNQSSQGVLALQAVCGAQDAASRVVGEAYVGGIVGYNARSGEALDALDPYADPVSGGARGGATLLIDCRNYAQVSGARYVGGIIGLNSQSTDLTVTGALNNGAVRFDGSKSTPAQLERVARNGSYYIAGITGRNSASGVIRASANNGRIDNRSAYVGGLVEVNEGVMLACYNAGSFPAGRDHVGGIAGLNRDSGAFTPKTIDAQTYTQATIAACATTGGVIQGGSFVGGIAADNHALIRDCSFTGDGRYGTDFGIQASGDAVGGIVGYNGPEGQLVACSTSGGSIKGRNLVGGVVGYAENPTLAGLTNDSRVLGESYVGGIVGYYPGGTLTGCANETRALVAGIDGRTQGSLTVNLLRADGQADALRLNYSQMGVGGITSVSAGGPISGCLNAGAVVGAVPAGGIVGVNPEDGRLAACYNFGRVVASSQGARLATSGSFLESIARNGDYAGGIAGRNAGELDNCYASARAGATNHVEGRWYVGGVVGLHQGGALTCQSVPVDSAECAVTGMGAVGGVAGRWEAGSVANNDKFPITATVNGDAAGRGASASAQRPASIGGVFGEVAAPVGLVNNFSFAGQVRYLSAPSDYVYAGGVLGVNPAGVSVVGCNLQGGALRINNTAEPSRNPHMGVGGIAGVNDGELLGCDVFEGASVSGGSYVGGIVGANHSDAGDNLRMITQRAPVTGTGSYVGGIVGYNTAPSALVYGAQEPLTLSGEVTVQGGDYVGGVVGASEGDLAYLINQGEVILTGKHGGGVAGAALNKGVARLSVTGCVNLGQVHAQPAASASNLGGVIGQIPAPAGGREVLVADCQNRGSVQGDRIGASCANIGGVVGEAQLGVTLDNCANTGTVTNAAPAGANVGGIVGYLNRAEAVSCANAGAVGYSHENNKSIALGGIAGRVTGGALTSCANEQGARLSVAAASGINQTAGGVGGVAGLTTRLGSASAPGADTRITDCTNAASIDLPKVPTVGGITGNSSGAALSGCRNTGDITGSTYVAGVTAMLYRTWFGVVEENTLTGCTNTGSVSGDGAAGILAAAQATETRFVLSNCQNSGPITARASGASQNGVGGILGRNYFPDGDNAILNCVNAGAVAPADGSQARNLGGIVGYSSKPLRIAQCSNSGAISRATASAGGIAGYLD